MKSFLHSTCTVLCISVAFALSDLHPALLQLKAVWPVPSVSRHDISSTFGPRILKAYTRYDFHRGVDISAAEGTPIVAALAGTFYGVRNYAGGGQTVIIDHDVDILFHDGQRSRISTYYMHLHSYSSRIESGSKGMSIEKGEIIGYAGMTGAAVAPHLHFEARLGSRCSLEYQLEHPTFSCASLGHDPHIHPLGLFPPPTVASDGVQVEVTQFVDGITEGVIKVSSTDAYPLANRYQLRALRSQSGLDDLHVLDLSDRTGFDASSTSAIDTQDKTKPYIEPVSFGKSSSTWHVEYRIPAGFASKQSGDLFIIVVTDVHDNIITRTNVSEITASW